MMILEEIGAFENFRPLWRARIWALERLIACNGAAGDLRWAMLELGLAFMRSTLGTGARAVALMASKSRLVAPHGRLFRDCCGRC